MGVSGVTDRERREQQRKGEKESIIVSPSPKKAMPPLRIAAVWERKMALSFLSLISCPKSLLSR